MQQPRNAYHRKHSMGFARHGRNDGKEHAVNGKAECREHDGRQYVAHKRAKQRAQRPANVRNDRKP